MLGDRRFALSRPVLIAASAVMLTLADRSVCGTTYTSTNVGGLIGGATTSAATALNSSDQVVGYYYTTATGGSAAASPFVYTPGAGGAAGTVVTVPGTYASYQSEATGISDAGLVVGYNEGALTAFTYNVSNGAFTSIPQGTDPQGVANYQIQLYGVNASGIAVGGIRNGTDSDPFGVTYNAATNTVTNFGAAFSGTDTPSNHVSNTAEAINSSGLIAGSGVDAAAGGTTAVPYIATPTAGGGYTFTDLNAAITASDPNFAGAKLGMSIDAQGNVAGSYTYGTRIVYNYPGGAFIYNRQSGTAVTLNGTSNNIIYSLSGLADVNGVPVAVGSEGSFYTSATTAFEYVNGNVVSLANAVPGYTITSASAVNGNGDVVAVGTPNSGGNPTAFLLQATLDTWNNAGGTGDGATWDTTQLNWHNNSSGVSTFSSASADNVLFSDANNGHYAVTLNSTVTPFAITFNNSSGNYVVSGTGTIGGGGGFVKTGTGSVTLNVASTYTGPTAVNQGKLTVNGSTAAVSAVTVASGATLSGTGTVAGTVAVAGTITGGSGATASDTAGKLTTGAEAWNTGGAYVAKYDGTRADQLVMSGLTAASGFIVNFQAASPGAVPAGTYVLAIDQGSSTAGAFNLNGLTLEVNGSTTLPSRYSFQDVASGGYDDLDVVVTSAPEPTSLGLLISVASPALLARRRRRQGRASL